MTNKEKAGTKAWNIAMGKEGDKADAKYNELQSIARENGLTVWCNIEMLLEEISQNCDKVTREQAFKISGEYYMARGKREALFKYLNAMSNTEEYKKCN